MSATYYPCSARVSSREVFFLWYTVDADGIVIESDNVVTSSSVQQCIDYAEARNLLLGAHEAIVFDINETCRWIDQPEKSPVDAPALLNTWNLLEDYLRSHRHCSDSSPLGEHDLYDRLFYANNLPAITPPGQRFDPDWTAEDKRRIAATLKQPMSAFRASLL